MLLNGLMASPTFSDWIQGQPLDVGGLLYGPSGKPQVSVLYIAHLSEAEKVFFVTLLLEQVISWMRAQSGTTSLRALVYMDEMFGYLPPHPANPPTKKPLLTLLKQARAFGLGLILATQNPVDLDYKALSNAGTWFIGRMQADRDKQRLLDGLEGVQVGKGGTSRADFDRMISAVQSRVFILHNVHERQPVVFHTRWAMSYLRGPMTRTQVRELIGEEPGPVADKPAPPSVAPVQPASAARPVSTAPAPPRRAAEAELPYQRVPPQLPSAVKQVFLPARIPLETALREMARDRSWSVRSAQEQEGHLVYEPALAGLARLRFPHTKSRQTHTEDVAYLLPVRGDVVDWAGAKVHLESGDLDSTPQAEAYFSDLPSLLGDARSLGSLEGEFEDYLYYNSSITLWYNPHLKLYSQVDETDKAFQRRCRQAAKEAYDAEVKKLTTKYKGKLDRLEAQLRREERELEEDEIEYDARKQEEMLSGAESLISLFAGRKSSSRLSTASRKRRMTRQAKADIEESKRVIDELEEQIEELEAEAKLEAEELTQKWNELVDEVEEVEVRPRRADVQIKLFALAWIPRWEVVVAGQALTMSAYEVESA
jgi:hypothetical protein